MAEKIATGFVELSTKGFKKVEKDLDRVSKKFKQTGGFASGAAKTIATAFSGAAVIGAIKSVADAYLEQEKSIMRMQAAFAAAGRTSAKQMMLLADQIEDLTLFSDDAARAAASMLAPFERLSNDVMRKLLPLAADVATTLGGDMPEAAQKLGKALNDPAKGMKLLRGMGIAFSEAESDVIKHMTETNRVAEAQEIILERLEKRYKGAAAAAKQGWTGVADNAKKSIDHITEDVGAYYANWLAPDGKSGKFGLQDLPFAFIGDQAGKDAYHKQMQTDADAAANAANVASGNVVVAAAKRNAAQRALTDYVSGAPKNQSEAQHQERMKQIGELRQAVIATEAAEKGAIDTRDRLAQKATDKEIKMKEALVQAEQAKAHRIADIQRNQIRRQDLEEQQRNDDIRKTLEDAMADEKEINDLRIKQAGQDAADLKAGELEARDKERADAQERLNRPFQSQRMGLEAFADAIQQSALGGVDPIQKGQLKELEKQTKLQGDIEKGLRHIGNFGPGAFA